MKLHYTKEKPKTPGWYYVRRGGNEAIVEVVEYSTREPDLEFIWFGEYKTVERLKGPYEFSNRPVESCSG